MGIVVAAPKGGQGKTTTAINLAAGLAEVEPNAVVIVDADEQFADIANAWELNPQYSLADVVHAGDDEVALKALLTHHDDALPICTRMTAGGSSSGPAPARRARHLQCQRPCRPTLLRRPCRP